MKQIINGKTYNTDTAELIATGDNGLYTNDCWYRSEELYRTKKGAYFICNEHGSLIPVDSKGNLLQDPDYYISSTIFDWLREWNVCDLSERELAFFGIEDA